MPVISKRVIRGGTATLVLKLTDLDSGFNLITDTVPLVYIYDPRGTLVAGGLQATYIGGGEYVINYETRENGLRGDYKAVFIYSLSGDEFKDQLLFQVI